MSVTILVCLLTIVFRLYHTGSSAITAELFVPGELCAAAPAELVCSFYLHSCFLHGIIHFIYAHEAVYNRCFHEAYVWGLFRPVHHDISGTAFDAYIMLRHDELYADITSILVFDIISVYLETVARVGSNTIVYDQHFLAGFVFILLRNQPESVL